MKPTDPKKTKRTVAEARWTEKLAERFCPVSSYFLANYHRLRPHDGARGLSSTEAMLVIQLLDFKWTAKAPFPSVGTLAERMDLTPRAVRAALQSLEAGGLVRREYRSNGKTNLFHFEGLYQRLEELLASDQARFAATNDDDAEEAA